MGGEAGQSSGLGKSHKARPVRPGKTHPCPPPSFHFQPQMRPPEGRRLSTLEGAGPQAGRVVVGREVAPLLRTLGSLAAGGPLSHRLAHIPPIGWSVCSLTAPGLRVHDHAPLFLLTPLARLRVCAPSPGSACPAWWTALSTPWFQDSAGLVLCHGSGLPSSPTQGPLRSEPLARLQRSAWTQEARGQAEGHSQ